LAFAVFLSFSTTSTQDLFGVTKDGSFYKGVAPERSTGAEWIKSAILIGVSDWNQDFIFPMVGVFLHPDGTLYNLNVNNIYKGPLPQQPSTQLFWINFSATLVCSLSDVTLNTLGVPFFDPDGKLYFVKDDRLCTMPSNSAESSQCSYTKVGTSGWSSFEFLFFDPEGILYGVENGKLHKRGPPTAADDNWLATSTLIGTAGWSDFQLLFFMSSGKLYGVFHDKFYKGLPPNQSIDAYTWMASSTLIGESGWSQFAMLMTPLHHE